MRTDREALIAGIAADPHNDLRKLVFADWLEEHGEPERAEFIRLAVGNKNPATRTKATEKRAKVLFAKHWRKWFGPFLEALDPEWGAAGFEVAPDREFEFRSASRPLLNPLKAGSGFVQFLQLHVDLMSSGVSLDRALRLEPVFFLSVCPTRQMAWHQLTGPALDQLQSLILTDPLSETGAILNDRNLTGVNELAVFATGQNRAVPPDVLRSLVASPLVRGLLKLRMSQVDTRGLRALSASRRLKLEELYLRGALSRPFGEALASASFASTLRSLTVENAAGIGVRRVSPMFTAVCEGRRWKALTELRVHLEGSGGVTPTGLRALAKASFLPQLEELLIPLDNKPDPKLITAVVERLDPARVRSLLFEQRGDVPMPECFVRKFGDRAIEGVDEEHGNAYWQVLPRAGA